jgi:hypothetical protein
VATASAWRCTKLPTVEWALLGYQLEVNNMESRLLFTVFRGCNLSGNDYMIFLLVLNEKCV